MFEYKIDITVEDKDKNQHIIKRYYVLPIMGRYKLKDTIDNKLKKDAEISQYKMINYNVVDWYEVSP